LNRVDDIIIFNELTKEDLRKIVDIELARVQKRVEREGVEIRFTSEARDLLAERGYDPKLGARPLKRVIQKLVLNPLAMNIIKGETAPGTLVEIRAREGEIVLDQGERIRAKEGLVRAE